YIQKLDLYTRSILKGKFIIYFSKGDNDTIEIHYFRSSKQRPIEELLS
ncbi:MAG: type II toxin-antitoxin system RelE/ParE family toxin, partial [Capnocytophaga sp.]